MPPANVGYMEAAYAVAAFVYLGYALVLLRRRARVRAALQRAGVATGVAPRDGQG